MTKTKKEICADIFIKTIQEIASNEEKRENFKSFLTCHFDEWVRRLRSPEDIIYEMLAVAELDINEVRND